MLRRGSDQVLREAAAIFLLLSRIKIKKNIKLIFILPNCYFTLNKYSFQLRTATNFENKNLELSLYNFIIVKLDVLYLWNSSKSNRRWVEEILDNRGGLTYKGRGYERYFKGGSEQKVAEQILSGRGAVTWDETMSSVFWWSAFFVFFSEHISRVLITNSASSELLSCCWSIQCWYIFYEL